MWMTACKIIYLSRKTQKNITQMRSRTSYFGVFFVTLHNLSTLIQLLYRMMNKLQLYIYKSLRGYKAVRNINPSENVQRHILEVRHALETLDYNPAEKYLFYMISYLNEGSLFTILRTIPDQPFDHLATTIFVPNGLQITADEFDDIVRRTTRMVSNPSVSADDLADLQQIFSREYPTEESPAAMVASQGRTYAVCFYGGSTGNRLVDYMGDKMYRTEYLPFEGVLLIDAELGVTSTAEDLTYVETMPHKPLLPPDLSSTEGFKPYVFGKVFDRPLLVPVGEVLEVTWKRQGFEDRLQEVSVTDALECLPAIEVNDSRKTISRESFFITSHARREPISDATIVVNGTEINGPVDFTLVELKNAEVEVTAPGFSTFTTRCDLASTTQALIQLPELRKIYRFELPVRRSELGAPIRFEIHTKRDLHDSPVEGYELTAPIQEGAHGYNHLTYVSGGLPPTMVERIIIGAVALIAGFLLGWLIMGGSSDKDHKDAPETETTTVAMQEEVAEQPAAEATPVATSEPAPAQVASEPAPAAQTATDASAGVKYLDDNRAWNRDDMERIPALQGLFDDLNNYRYTQIVDKWGPRLAASKNFAAVVRAVEQGSRKKKFVPAAGATYCRPGDLTISYINYTYRIDP